MSATAVPLRPIAKGSLTKLWAGIVVLVLAAAALAWAGSTRSLKVEVLTQGSGSSPTLSDVVLISYVGKLSDGTVFDQNDRAPLPVEGVVPGFSQALQQMKKGGHYKVVIPPHLGYGSKAVGPIPANSTLEFDVKLLDFKSRGEIEQMQRELQAMQMQGAPGAPPHPAP